MNIYICNEDNNSSNRVKVLLTMKANSIGYVSMVFIRFIKGKVKNSILGAQYQHWKAVEVQYWRGAL